jgi:hypothetical protein
VVFCIKAWFKCRCILKSRIPEVSFPHNEIDDNNSQLSRHIMGGERDILDYGIMDVYGRMVHGREGRREKHENRKREQEQGSMEELKPHSGRSHQPQQWFALSRSTAQRERTL